MGLPFGSRTPTMDGDMERFFGFAWFYGGHSPA